MNAVLFSLVCLVICVHAVGDLNDAHRATSRVRKSILLLMAGASFAGIFRPAMDEDVGVLTSTAVVAVMTADCLIRRYWRHLYHDRHDPRLAARLSDRIG